MSTTVNATVVPSETEATILQILALRASAKEAYMRADAMEEQLLVELLDQVEPGQEMILPTSERRVFIRDAFARGNVAYRQASVRRHEIVPAKE